MPMPPLTVSFYDTKPYDRDYMLAAAGAELVTWRFHEFRLTAETAATAVGSAAVCVFVNDKLDRDCLQQLAAALRCAGFNQVDLASAKEFGIAITRVPAYSLNRRRHDPA